MLKFLILICLIIKTHSWTWKDYPSPRGTTYWKCGITKPAWVCDPDGMLNDQERKKIVELPRSKFICAREGLRLVVALAKVKIGLGNGSSGLTDLCMNDRQWTSTNPSSCEADVHGIELNTDGFRYCHWMPWLRELHEEDYKNLIRHRMPDLTIKIISMR
uniref:Uncharacterized protein n=1 Tax=Meloidogyne enterolobii TaxID=390850 RepID=A0A6V7VZY7_MELEN|nr:unnamed protein product [Meloidogyne enterolobii]